MMQGLHEEAAKMGAKCGTNGAYLSLSADTKKELQKVAGEEEASLPERLSPSGADLMNRSLLRVRV